MNVTGPPGTAAVAADRDRHTSRLTDRPGVGADRWSPAPGPGWPPTGATTVRPQLAGHRRHFVHRWTRPCRDPGGGEHRPDCAAPTRRCVLDDRRRLGAHVTAQTGPPFCTQPKRALEVADRGLPGGAAGAEAALDERDSVRSRVVLIHRVDRIQPTRLVAPARLGHRPGSARSYRHIAANASRRPRSMSRSVSARCRAYPDRGGTLGIQRGGSSPVYAVGSHRHKSQPPLRSFVR